MDKVLLRSQETCPFVLSLTLSAAISKRLSVWEAGLKARHRFSFVMKTVFAIGYQQNMAAALRKVFLSQFN